MTRIHTITYNQAKQWYDSGRKYRSLGTKLTNNIWLNYDAANDRYTLAYTYSKYYEVMNAQGEKQHKRAGASERDKYTQEFIGFVYRDHLNGSSIPLISIKMPKLVISFLNSAPSYRDHYKLYPRKFLLLRHKLLNYLCNYELLLAYRDWEIGRAHV